VLLLTCPDVDSTRYMRTIFAPFCKVLEARNMKEALALCRETPPNLVIADALLPYNDGQNLLDTLRSPSSPTSMRLVPYMLITGHDNARPDAALAADDYLLRPFNARDLLSRGHMQLQLGKRRLMLEYAYEQRAGEMKMLMDESPVGIFRAEANGSIFYFNETLLRMSGHPRDTDLNDWADYVSEDTRQACIDALQNFVNTPEQTEYTVVGQYKYTGAYCELPAVEKADGESP
jgi:CheY-like chemotaxis protein